MMAKYCHVKVYIVYTIHLVKCKMFRVLNVYLYLVEDKKSLLSLENIRPDSLFQMELHDHHK